MIMPYDRLHDILLATAPRFYLMGAIYRGLRLERLHPRLCSFAPTELFVP